MSGTMLLTAITLKKYSGSTLRQTQKNIFSNIHAKKRKIDKKQLIQ